MRLTTNPTTTFGPVLENKGQIIRLMNAVVVTALITLLAAETYAQSKSYTFELRVNCRKGGSGGCTAKGTACANAPSGRYFAVQQVSGQDAGSHSPGTPARCGVAETGAKGVSLNGLLAPTSMCAWLHGESGGGIGGIGKEYFAKCKYTAVTYPLP